MTKAKYSFTVTAILDADQYYMEGGMRVYNLKEVVVTGSRKKASSESIYMKRTIKFFVVNYSNIKKAYLNFFRK